MSDLDGFSKRIKDIAQSITTNVDKEVIQAGILVQQAVILATPVDTGRARGNWLASLGLPIESPSEREDQSGHVTVSENNSIITGRKTGQNIYITNNLPYINKLNNGYSAQAPAMFVEKASQVAITYLKNTRVVK